MKPQLPQALQILTLVRSLWSFPRLKQPVCDCLLAVADSCSLGNGQYFQVIAGEPSKYKWIVSPGVEYIMSCAAGSVFSVQNCLCIAAPQPVTTAAPGKSLSGLIFLIILITLVTSF